eukprot:2772443-Prymnesium_polylepis.1
MVDPQSSGGRLYRSVRSRERRMSQCPVRRARGAPDGVGDVRVCASRRRVCVCVAVRSAHGCVRWVCAVV